MNTLLISAKTEQPTGGIAIWTNHYLTGCQTIDHFSCDLVNVAVTGRRAACATAKRDLKDEAVRTYRIIKQLNEKLKHGTYDVAHLNTSIGTFGIIRDYIIARRIARKGIPIALHFHCDIPKWDTSCITTHFLQKILKLSKMNFVLCENSKRYLDDKFSAKSTKIPNFVQEDMIATSKTIRDHIQKAVFVGRVSADKGAAEIFKIAKHFSAITFLLVGEVNKEIAVLEHPKNIVFAGIKNHEAVITCLDDADVFLFPSHTEGFSLALAEAMARGLPAITTDVGANAEMLEQKGGIVVPVGDVVAMETALLRLNDPEIRKNMSLWNLNKVKERYGTNQVMQILIQNYKKYCGELE